MRKPDEIELMRRVLTHPRGHLRDGADDLVDVTKREHGLLLKWTSRGWWDYGLAPRCGWLTDEGRIALREVVCDVERRANPLVAVVIRSDITDEQRAAALAALDALDSSWCAALVHEGDPT